jgi:glycosyl transferase family 87
MEPPIDRIDCRRSGYDWSTLAASWRSRAPRVAAVCLLAAVAAWVFVFKASRRMPDFEVYWRAGARAAHAEPLYRADDAAYQFKYFPAFAVVAMPLGTLPLAVAKPIWFTLSVAALVALLPLSVSILPERRKPVALLIAVLIVGLGKYYAEDLVLGQINLVFALVATAAIAAANAGREALAGALVVFAIVLKPYALILLPWIAARRRAPSVIAASAGVVLAAILPAAVYGVDGTVRLYQEWWTTVTETTAGTLTHSDNVSLAAMYTKWFGFGNAATVLAGLSAVALLAIAAVVFARRRGLPSPDGLEAGLLLTLTPLLSPQGWDYVVLVSTPAIAYVANYLSDLPRSLQPIVVLAVAVIGLTLFDLLGRRLHYALMDLSVITLAFLVVIASLAALRLHRIA